MVPASFIRTVLAASVAVGGCAFAATAQAALVAYDFEAQIDTARGSGTSLRAAGIPTDGELTGSFSYDSVDGWHVGSTTILSSRSSELTLTVDQVGMDSESAMLVASARSDQIGILGTDDGIWVTLYLPSQNVNQGSLPTSLTLEEGASITVGTGFSSVSANLTALTGSGTAVAVPELDPTSGTASLALLMGGVALLSPRRRRDGASLAA